MKTVMIYFNDDTLPNQYRDEKLGHGFTDGFLELTGDNWADLIPVSRIKKVEVYVSEE